jgi:hypothetical protein
VTDFPAIGSLHATANESAKLSGRGAGQMGQEELAKAPGALPTAAWVLLLNTRLK